MLFLCIFVTLKADVVQNELFSTDGLFSFARSVFRVVCCVASLSRGECNHMSAVYGLDTMRVDIPSISTNSIIITWIRLMFRLSTGVA